MSASPQNQPQRRVVMPNAQTPRPPRPQPVDIRQTKEYKAASRRWVSTIVALPILMYTSYELYSRSFGNKKAKHPGEP